MIIKPKLLISTDYFLPRWNSTTRFIVEVLPILMNRFDVTVVCPKHDSSASSTGNLDIIRLPLKRRFFKGLYENVETKNIPSVIKDKDLILNMTLGPIGKSVIKNAKLNNKKVISYVLHLDWEILSKRSLVGELEKEINILISKHFYRKCDLLIVPSGNISHILEKKHIRNPKVVIKPGVNHDSFNIPEDKSKAKSDLSIDPNYKVIGYVGKLTREKNFSTLYHAFKRLEPKYNNLFLLVIGSGSRHFEKALKNKENMRIIKRAEDISRYLGAMDIFVNPSLFETWSLSTMEAMSSGVPVVSSKVGELQKYLKDKENILYFSKRNSLLLSLKIEWLLKEEYVRNTLGLNSRETIIKCFDWEETSKQVLRVLESFT